MKLMILLAVVALVRCSTTPESTTAEVAEESIGKDVPATEETPTLSTTSSDMNNGSNETNKNKRTIEQNLGYGYNEFSGRLLRQYPEHGHQRNYYSQPQNQYPQGNRYYSTLRYSGVSPAAHYQHTKQQEQLPGRPHQSSGSSPQVVPSINVQLPSTTHYVNIPPTNSQASESPSSQYNAYFPKPAYLNQQSPVAASPSAVASNYASTSHLPPSTHTVALFPGSQGSQGPLSGPGSFLYSHSSLPHSVNTAGQHGPHPFFTNTLGNYARGPILFQHPGTALSGLLQNTALTGHPFSNISPGASQIIPVIILRVGDGHANNPYAQVTPAYVHPHRTPLSPNYPAVNLQALLYQYLQGQQQQHYHTPVYTPTEAFPQQLVYSEADTTSNADKSVVYLPSANTAEAIEQNKKNIYVPILNKKPLYPTPNPLPQKSRKNGIAPESEQQSENDYPAYKYQTYKEKA